METHADAVEAVGKQLMAVGRDHHGGLRAGGGGLGVHERAAVRRAVQLAFEGAEEEAVGGFAELRAEQRIVRCRAYRFEQGCQATRRFTALLGDGQVAFGDELHFDQQELPGLGGLALVQRVLGQFEPAAGLQLAHAALAVHAAGLGLVLFDLHAAEPVAALLFLPVVLALVFVTFQGRQGGGDL